jgi:CPA2 family monovalent cation:H+ antiporter-2
LPHAVSLISTLAAGFGLALLFGFVAARLGLPALIGYLDRRHRHRAGDARLRRRCRDRRAARRDRRDAADVRRRPPFLARRPAGGAQGGAAGRGGADGGGDGAGRGRRRFWGWSLGAALVFGLTLSVASTVVLLKALEGRGELESGDGRIAIGWLVVEDLAMVLVLVVLPPLAGALGGSTAAGPWRPPRLDPGEDFAEVARSWP